MPGAAGHAASARAASSAHSSAATAGASSRAVTQPVVPISPTSPLILIGGPVRLPLSSQLGVGQQGLAFGSAVHPALGLRGRLSLFTPSVRAVGLVAPAVTPASLPIGRYLGGGAFGPPAPVLQQPPVQRALARAGGLPLFTTNASFTPPAMTMAAAAANAAQNAANAALAQALGTPMERMLGGPIGLAWPPGTMQIANIPNAVMLNRAAVVRNQTVIPGLYGLPLTRVVNAVYTPAVTRATTRTALLPTTELFRRMVNNLSTFVRENVQGGVTIRGPQGTIFLPAQQLQAATLPTTGLLGRIVNNLGATARGNARRGVAARGLQNAVFLPAQQLQAAAA